MEKEKLLDCAWPSLSLTHTPVYSAGLLVLTVCALLLRPWFYGAHDLSAETKLCNVYSFSGIKRKSFKNNIASVITDRFTHKLCWKQLFCSNLSPVIYLWFYFTYVGTCAFILYTSNIVVLLILVQVLLYISKIMKPNLRHHHIVQSIKGPYGLFSPATINRTYSLFESAIFGLRPQNNVIIFLPYFCTCRPRFTHGLAPPPTQMYLEVSRRSI